MSERKVYVVKNPENESKMPGGFCMHGMGPDKVTIEPGKKIPESWVYPATLEAHLAKGDMKYADGGGYKKLDTDVQDDDAPEAPAPSTDEHDADEPDDDTSFTEEMREEHCIFSRSDLKNEKRASLDEIVAGIEQETGVAQPKFGNIEDIIEFLTSGVK